MKIKATYPVNAATLKDVINAHADAACEMVTRHARPQDVKVAINRVERERAIMLAVVKGTKVPAAVTCTHEASE